MKRHIILFITVCLYTFSAMAAHPAEPAINDDLRAMSGQSVLGKTFSTRDALSEISAVTPGDQFELALQYAAYNKAFNHDLESLELARFWLERAAEQGHVEAQVYLGWMNFWGVGGQRNLIQAGKWLWEAVKQDNLEAKLSLAIVIGGPAFGFAALCVAVNIMIHVINIMDQLIASRLLYLLV